MAVWSNASHGDSPRPKLRPNLEGAGFGDPGGAEGVVWAPLFRGGGVGGIDRGFLGDFTSVGG